MTDHEQRWVLYHSGQIERHPLRWWLCWVDGGFLAFSLILVTLAVVMWWRG